MNQPHDAFARLELQTRRLLAVVEIQNLMGLYQTLHTANRQEEVVALFARTTPGGRLVFHGNIFEGFEGVQLHYLGFMEDASRRSPGSLWMHQLTSPIIEVAGDAQTARGQWDSIGGGIGIGTGGRKITIWDSTRYHIDFIREDDRWVIYNLDAHGIFITPFDGPGWGEVPQMSMAEFFAGNPEMRDYRPKTHGRTAHPYHMLERGSDNADALNLRPEPPRPYQSWDIRADPWVVEKAPDAAGRPQ